MVHGYTTSSAARCDDRRRAIESGLFSLSPPRRCALLGMALFGFLREPAGVGASKETLALTEVRSGLREIFENRLVAVLITVFIGANFVAAIFLTWMPSFLNRKFHMSLAMAGLSATAYLQVASVIGVISGGLFADRLARQRLDGRMRIQALALVAGTPFLFVTGWTKSIPVLVIAAFAFGDQASVVAW